MTGHVVTGAIRRLGTGAQELCGLPDRDLGVGVAAEGPDAIAVTITDALGGQIVAPGVAAGVATEVPAALTRVIVRPEPHRGPVGLVVVAERAASGIAVVGQLIGAPPDLEVDAVHVVTNELEPATRGMLLLLDELVRLDVLVDGDALTPFVRNLSPWAVALRGDPVGPGSSVEGEAAALGPARAALEVVLGEHRVLRVLLATVQAPARGAVRVSALAVSGRVPDRS